MLAVLANSLLSIIPAYVASQKGRSAAAFWALGTFVSFVISLLAVIAIPRGEQKNGTQLRVGSGTGAENDLLELPEEIQCPNCAEYVKFEAKICRFCSAPIEEITGKVRKQVAQNVENNILARANAAHEHEARIAALNQDRREKFAAFRKTLLFKILTGVAILGVAAIAIATVNTVQSLISSQNEMKARVAELRSIVDDCAKRVQISDLGIVESDNGLEILKSDFFANSNLEDSKFEACLAAQTTDFNQIEQTYSTGYGSNFQGLKVEYSYELRFDFSGDSTWTSGAAKSTMPANIQDSLNALESCQIRNTFPLRYDDFQKTWKVMLNFLEPGATPTTSPEASRAYITASQAKCFDAALKSTPGVERWLWPGWYVYDFNN